jgi:hypothetical protein
LTGNILSTRGLNTLMFSEPYAKLSFAAHLVSLFEKVIYIDLDTTFAAYFNEGLIKANSIDIYLPSEGRFVPMIKDVLESMDKGSLVIFDSVNSFYNLFPARRKTSALNHLLSVLLMLLVKRGIDESIPILATSMLRYRKDGDWVQSPASRRLFHQKSAVMLRANRKDNDIMIVVERHESIPTQTQIFYKDSLITI